MAVYDDIQATSCSAVVYYLAEYDTFLHPSLGWVSTYSTKGQMTAPRGPSSWAFGDIDRNGKQTNYKAAALSQQLPITVHMVEDNTCTISAESHVSLVQWT